VNRPQLLLLERRPHRSIRQPPRHSAPASAASRLMALGCLLASHNMPKWKRVCSASLSRPRPHPARGRSEAPARRLWQTRPLEDLFSPLQARTTHALARTGMKLRAPAAVRWRQISGCAGSLGAHRRCSRWLSIESASGASSPGTSTQSLVRISRSWPSLLGAGSPLISSSRHAGRNDCILRGVWARLPQYFRDAPTMRNT